MTVAERELARCSFCGKSNTQVATLVAGPGVYICNECVELSAELVAQRAAAEPLPRVEPWKSVTDVEQALASLPAMAAASEQVERNLLDWVRRARELGASWARIGEALGTTRQSAWERFSGEE